MIKRYNNISVQFIPTRDVVGYHSSSHLSAQFTTSSSSRRIKRVRYERTVALLSDTKFIGTWKDIPVVFSLELILPSSSANWWTDKRTVVYPPTKNTWISSGLGWRNWKFMLELWSVINLQEHAASTDQPTHRPANEVDTSYVAMDGGLSSGCGHGSWLLKRQVYRMENAVDWKRQRIWSIWVRMRTTGLITELGWMDLIWTHKRLQEERIGLMMKKMAPQINSIRWNWILANGELMLN